MKLRSLRSRLLLASILWTCGLLFVAHMIAVVAVHAYGPLRVSRFAFRSAIGVFSVISLAAMVIGYRQARKGLSSFDQLRSRLASVREGRERTVSGPYPSEVEPLVNDLNALLEHHDRQVERAAAKAGDLAHGLKTPLAVLSQEADRARAAGQQEFAAVVAQQVERMRRQVDYHLAHARAAASGATPGTRSHVGDSVEALARTLRRLHAEKGIVIDIDDRADHTVKVERPDLDEMLGNLLDNACKWASARVRVTSAARDGAVIIDVDDDGPGVDPSLRERVLHRGVRADEAAAGSGFGLAIVRDLAELYGGAVSLGDSPLGGLRATLRLPA
jgi:signal transduction histidine kinase